MSVVGSVAPTETPKPNTEQPAPPPPVTPEVPSMEGKKPDEMSSKFAALAKKERYIRQEAQKYKQMEAQLKERERQIAERERQWEEEFRARPLEALKKRNLTYQDLTQAALNDGKFQPETEIKEVRSEIERLRQEQAEKERKALEEQQTAAQRAEQEAIDSFKASIAQTIEAKKDVYELTHLFDASELVYSTVEEHFERTKAQGQPKIISIEEACELVEKYLESEIERTAQTKKFQQKFLANKTKEDTQKAAPKTTTTLNNSMTPTPTTASILPAATEADRIKRALAALG